MVGTSLTLMTSTGHVVRGQQGPTTQVLPLVTVVMVSLLSMLFIKKFLGNVQSAEKETHNTTTQISFLICCFFLLVFVCFFFLVGFYMSIQTSSPRSHGDKAILLFSPQRSEVGKLSCLKFYYHMYGAAINRLNVYNGNRMVFTKYQQQGDRWLYAEMTVFVQNTVSSL